MLDVGHQEISKTNSKRSLEVRVRLQRLGARNLKLQNLSEEKKKPFRVCIHGQALKDCELSAGKSGARN